jgi:hypothetical protein
MAEELTKASAQNPANPIKHQQHPAIRDYDRPASVKSHGWCTDEDLLRPISSPLGVLSYGRG